MTQSIFTPSSRYPDPNVYILDPSFAKYRIYSSSIECLGTGMRWAEGPAYFPSADKDGAGYLLVSDIPNNRIMKWDEATNEWRVHSTAYNYANGNTRDRQGRLVTCEHSVTRRIVRTEHDGSITVLADQFEGKRLNAPNDVVVKSDDSIWFTDPTFGINGEWEGERAKSEQATTNVYRVDKGGEITAVITDLINPNGLAFSPDEQYLYVVECGRPPHRSIWRYRLQADGRMVKASSQCEFIKATDYGALDGFRVDMDGNLWCGWGASAVLQDKPADIGGGMKAYLPRGQSEALDGVKVFNQDGKAIGFIRLPERCANLEFGGPKRNRLYMASCHSLYALYVESHGAV
jgi:gluconolactonase